jgi:23S rRNA G2445 N2-methylase RlmL
VFGGHRHIREPLHKRGYREDRSSSLKETIAASLLFFPAGTGIRPSGSFLRIGSIAIEAALYALDFARDLPDALPLS